MIKKPSLISFILFSFILNMSSTQAGEALVAVASNFTAPMQAIAQTFEEETEYEVTLVFGSSGKIFAQISHGAPFDVFLSADQQKPQKLADNQLAEPSSRFTYALGTLALWASTGESPELLLKENRYQHIAIANPKLAPYGQAATQVLEQLGLTDKAKSKLVMGENITQAWQYTASGNAELGFVAMAQLANVENEKVWRVPMALYSPIKQDAVLLSRAKNNAAAKALLNFLTTDKALAIIKKYGYQTPGMEIAQGTIEQSKADEPRVQAQE